jgi:hypothetical protein
MHGRLFISGLWQIRDESLEDSVVRVGATFQRLSQLSSAWDKWFREYRSFADLKRDRHYLTDNPERIRDVLLHYRECLGDGNVDEVLGYVLSACAAPSNATGLEMSHLSLWCCATTPDTSNRMSLELPVRASAPSLYDEDLLCMAVVALAEVWDPDWLSVWEQRLKMVKVSTDPYWGGPEFNWINYLPTRCGIIDEKLPPRWKWYERTEGMQVYVYEGGLPDAENPADIEAFERLVASIRWLPPYAP